MTKPPCKTCQHYWPKEGECRRKSPSFHGWPKLKAEETGCSKHTPRVDEREGWSTTCELHK